MAVDNLHAIRQVIEGLAYPMYWAALVEIIPMNTTKLCDNRQGAFTLCSVCTTVLVLQLPVPVLRT